MVQTLEAIATFRAKPQHGMHPVQMQYCFPIIKWHSISAWQLQIKSNIQSTLALDISSNTHSLFNLHVCFSGHRQSAGSEPCTGISKWLVIGPVNHWQCDMALNTCLELLAQAVTQRSSWPRTGPIAICKLRASQRETSWESVYASKVFWSTIRHP